MLLLLLLLSHFSRVRLCVTPEMAAHQAPRSLGFSRQEHWSGLPFLSPMQESEKWKWSHSVVSNPQRPHGLQPTRLLHPWDFPGKSTGVGCHCLLRKSSMPTPQLTSYFPRLLKVLLYFIALIHMYMCCVCNRLIVKNMGCGANSLVSNPGSTTYWLCSLGQLPDV